MVCILQDDNKRFLKSHFLKEKGNIPRGWSIEERRGHLHNMRNRISYKSRLFTRIQFLLLSLVTSVWPLEILIVSSIPVEKMEIVGEPSLTHLTMATSHVGDIQINFFIVSESHS